MAKFKIGIFGAFGIGSSGDEAALEVFLSIVRGFADVTVFQRNPDNPNGAHLNFAGVEVRRKLEWPTKELSIGKNFRGFNPGEHLEATAMIDNIGKLDLLVLGPGDFINEDNIGMARGALAEMVCIAQLAQFARVPYIVFAASARELYSGLARYQTKWLLRNACSVTLRDPLSMRSIRRIGWWGECELAPDPVLALPILQPRYSPTYELAINVRNVAYKGAAYQDAYRALLRSIHQHFSPFIVIGNYNGETANDLAEAHCIFGKSGAYTEEAGVTPQLTRRAYTRAKRALVTRLHAAVYCHQMGVPFAAIAYEQKVRAFCQSVNAPVVAVDRPEEALEKLMSAVAEPFSPPDLTPYYLQIIEALQEARRNK